MSKKNNRLAKEKDWRIRVFDSLSFPTLILRPDRVIVTANQIFLEKFGAMEQIVGKRCHEVFYHSKEPCSSEMCPLPKVIADRKGQSILSRLTDEHGDQKWDDRVFSPILDDEGEILYIMESVRDVTRLKTLEKELRETKEFFENVIQSSASAIVAADRTGNILFMNRAAEDLFGYAVEDVLGTKSVEQVYPAGKAREIMRKMRDETIGGKGKLPPTKITIINASGEEIPVEITAAIIYEGDREMATMGIYNDLRERLAVERKLEEAQAQVAHSEKMASLGQLAAGVAHEINNPLTGILLYANLVLERFEREHPLREDLEYVVEDTIRCKNIVKNLLAYSRQTNPSKEILQMNTLVENSLSLIRDQELFMNIEVIKEMSADMMLVHADKNQLCQAIINLVINAVDAMARKGILTFRTYRDKPSGKVYLEISDTGSGIPDENVSKIFDPFFTTKALGKGTGLGLSTAYGLVKENGGDISVKETSAEGTTFLLELPLYVPSDDNQII
ncbi:MAG: PAS domain S-box protein [Desulfobacteraceae bacterium]|jgi:PAS domain S-box-containing protein